MRKHGCVALACCFVSVGCALVVPQQPRRECARITHPSTSMARVRLAPATAAFLPTPRHGRRKGLLVRCSGHRQTSSPPSNASQSAVQERERPSMMAATAPARPPPDGGSPPLPPPGITPLARFNNYVNYHRHGVGSDAIVISDDDGALDCERDAAGGSYGPRSSSSGPPVVVVDFVDLMLMAFSSATSAEMFQKRRDLARRLGRWGGWCLVEMNDPIEREVLDGMWDAMHVLFGEEESADARRGGGDVSQRLRRQILKRNGTSSSSDNPGYDFVQTSLVGGSLRPEWIQEEAGELGARQARDAHRLLSQLCRALAVVAYAGASGDDGDDDARAATPARATALVDRLLADSSGPTSGSYHRLCRYLPLQGGAATPNEERPSSWTSSRWGESLRPHVDWTISTAIPVSSIAGLELYVPGSIPQAGPSASSQPTDKPRWIRVEQVVQSWRKDERSEGETNRDSSGSANPPRWNSRYVVVFAGAWLELLTEGKIEATLHRVVARRPSAAAASAAEAGASSGPRLSAPFFLRPHERVFERVDEVFDDPDNLEMAGMCPTDAVREMSRFLHGSELSRRQP